PLASGRLQSDELSGQWALVTGSTTGIGSAIADALESRGAQVIRHGRRKKGQGDHYIGADLSDPAACDRLSRQAWNISGGLDILILNAGADTLTGDAAKWTFDDKLEALLAVDVKATIRLARALGARMKDRGRGSLITIGWDQAETGMEGDSGQLFGATKAA